MATTDFTSGVTVIPADWLNDIDAFYYELFGATGGKAYIGDTSNADLTIGLTINQLANDDQILALKSSDVAHGMTGATETDTYGAALKESATAGGLKVSGFTEVTIGLNAEGSGVTDDTTKSTAGTGYIALSALKKSGAGRDVAGADANLVVIRNVATTRFIFDAEGSFHADVESTTFDKYDDIALLDAMDMEFQRRQGDPVKKEYSKFLTENKRTLQRLGIVNYYDPKGKRVMVNLTKQAMLHNGAIRQIARRMERVEAKLLEAK